MTKWDIAAINSWKSDDFPRGGVIPEAGNSDQYVTGGWRSERPVRSEEACNHCLLCWIACPDSAINVTDEKIGPFNYDHCKGCGICAAECPQNAIEMVPEGCELPGVKR